MYNTRVAPSPTGDMHLGTARTALFNYLAARATGGKFILRIDDTDKERNTPEATQTILDVMDWLGLEYDEIHYQSKRMDIYDKAISKLLNDGRAHVIEGGAMALKVDKPMMWQDTIAGIQDATDPKQIEIATTTVLYRADGTPTYHFATCVDDLDMGVNWIIRGADHFTNTHRHATIIGHLGATLMPAFAHVGLIMKDKKKMSKRDDAASMLNYREAGYSPACMIDYMMRLGWAESSGRDRKKITLDDALEIFLDGKLKANPASFDQAKLDNLRKKHRV